MVWLEKKKGTAALLYSRLQMVIMRATLTYQMKW